MGDGIDIGPGGISGVIRPGLSQRRIPIACATRRFWRYDRFPVRHAPAPAEWVVVAEEPDREAQPQIAAEFLVDALESPPALAAAPTLDELLGVAVPIGPEADMPEWAQNLFPVPDPEDPLSLFRTGI